MRLLLKTIKSTAKVAWESSNDEGGYEIGVEFGTLSPENLAALAKFISIEQGKTDKKIQSHEG